MRVFNLGSEGYFQFRAGTGHLPLSFSKLSLYGKQSWN